MASTTNRSTKSTSTADGKAKKKAAKAAKKASQGKGTAKKKAEKKATSKKTAPTKAETKAAKKQAALDAEALAKVQPHAVEQTTTALHAWDGDVATLLRVAESLEVTSFDTRATPGWEGTRAEADARTAALGEELSELQERLFAQGRSGDTRSVLLVLQGLDTSGKGGIVRHVLGQVDPQGVALRSFGVPTAEELTHHFLWRVRRSLPPGGRIGVFDRSHYEDVLVARVDELAPPEVIERRYAEINRFERQVTDAGTVIVKVALVISADEQYQRLRERLLRKDKHWKFSSSDLRTRERWPLYADAYQRVFSETSTEIAPWHVIPADRKWYSRLAVSELLVQALRGLELEWPVPDFDVSEALKALDATAGIGSAS